ncbi:MAG: hypothetical protein ABIP30_16260 [Ferruginibacter sp.]
MVYTFFKRLLLLLCTLISANQLFAQPKYNLKFKHSDVYAGIEVGSKGVKMSILEIGKNAQKENIFNILKDTSSNTDFISFTDPTYSATLNSFYNLYNTAVTEYKIAPSKIYTVVSSGVKVQAEKSDKSAWITKLTNDFKKKVDDPSREVAVIDVTDEARLSHMGIVPDERRYSTFLIDIGSGNTKGGFFPNGDTKTLRLFELSWGTKSVANATDKRSGDDKSLATFDKNLYRVLSGDAKNEIVYAVNVSNAYNMSDYIAFSGGIAWSAATLMFPELIDNPVVPVTYEDMVKFNDRIMNNYSSLSDVVITGTLTDKSADKDNITSEVKRVNKVFDQKSLLAGTGLLLNIMRQFEGVYEKKQFYLVKNGQVGWISAYVNQHLSQ